ALNREAERSSASSHDTCRRARCSSSSSSRLVSDCCPWGCSENWGAALASVPQGPPRQRQRPSQRRCGESHDVRGHPVRRVSSTLISPDTVNSGWRNLRGAGQPSYWTLVSLDTLVSQDERSCAASGSFRIRFPVAAKTALARAGPVIDVPGSPSPPGGSRLRTRCTSIVETGRASCRE